MKKHILWVAILTSLAFSHAQAAAQTAAELIEQARAQSREIEELKKVMESPDRNLRIAAFQAMMASDNPLFSAFALEAGLASTDSLLRAQALRSAIFNLDGLLIDLTVDPDAPKETKEAAETMLVEKGPTLELRFIEKMPETDAIMVQSYYKGTSEVRGLNYVFSLSFRGEQTVGTLTLIDDSTLRGEITSGQRRYIGTAKLR